MAGYWRADTVPRFSVTDLRHAVGFRYPGNVGRIAWVFRGIEILACRVAYLGDSVLMSSQGRERWRGNLPTEQLVELTSTPCNFGGIRCWFRCPKCNRRVAVLYMRSRLWSCRECAKVRYSSQHEGVEARLRLGASQRLQEPLGPKPKGMHWETFIRLVISERRLRAAWIQCIAAKLPNYSKEFSYDQQ
jgi:hypothetical protein